MKDLLSTAMHKTKAIAIRIIDVHFAIAPTLISRFQINDDTCGLQFPMERIHIFDAKKDYATRHSITGKRGNMHLNVVPRQAHVTRISAAKRSIREGLPEAKALTVKLFRRS
jgi:hypothetical protein